MCGGKNVTFGVFDRIELIKDKKQTKKFDYNKKGYAAFWRITKINT